MMVERRRRADKWRVVAYLLVACALSFGLWRGEENRKNADRKIRMAAIERTEQVKQEAEDRAVQVEWEAERSRREVLIRTCREFNRNHDAAIAKLDELIADLPPGRRRERAKASRASTVALLATLAPKRRCVRRAERLIKP